MKISPNIFWLEEEGIVDYLCLKNWCFWRAWYRFQLSSRETSMETTEGIKDLRKHNCLKLSQFNVEMSIHSLAGIIEFMPLIDTFWLNENLISWKFRFPIRTFIFRRSQWYKIGREWIYPILFFVVDKKIIQLNFEI